MKLALLGRRSVCDAAKKVKSRTAAAGRRSFVTRNLTPKVSTRISGRSQSSLGQGLAPRTPAVVAPPTSNLDGSTPRRQPAGACSGVPCPVALPATASVDGPDHHALLHRRLSWPRRARRGMTKAECFPWNREWESTESERSVRAALAKPSRPLQKSLLANRRADLVCPEPRSNCRHGRQYFKMTQHINITTAQC